ncbi:MAG: alginate export family protein [Candidatus Delongbacteria bacterium]
MKKALLFSVMALALTAQAADVKFDGQVRYRMDNTNGTFNSDVDSYNVSKLRTRLAASVSPQDGLNIYIQAQDSRTIGDPATGVSASTADDEGLGVHQAYFTWNCQALSGLTILAGRFEYSKADERFFGKSDWNNVGLAHEGWALFYQTPIGVVDVFGVKAAENMASKQDVTNFGIYFNNILDKRIDLIFNNLNFGEVDTDADGELDAKNSFNTIALHYDNVYMDKLGVNFNFATQMGADEVADVDYTGMMYGLDVNYDLGLGFLNKVGFGYESTSADDPDTGDYGWQELFATGHKFWGLQDLVTPGAAGLNDIQLNFAGDLPLGIGYKLDYHMFSYIEDTGFEGNTDLGSELDLSLMKKMDNFGVNLGYSMFTPTDNIAPAGDPQSAMYLQFTAGF